MSSLNENLNSDYLAAANRLQPKSAPNEVTVYVESDEDIAFWYNILRPYPSDKVQFNVLLPAASRLLKGKTAALNRGNDIFQYLSEGQLGKFLLICVDSDYDYLLHGLYKDPHKAATAEKINHSNFILQTYTYSTENYKCYAESLDNVCTVATLNSKTLINFSEILRQYSMAVYDLLTWNLLFYAEGRESDFSLKNFTAQVKISQMPPLSELHTIIGSIKQNVARKVSKLQTDYPEFISKIKQQEKKLTEKGLSKESAYLFLQGHVLYDNFVKIILQRVCEKLTEEKIQSIRNSDATGVQIRDEINAYKNKTTEVSKVLAANKDFEDCFLFEKIREDINKYMTSLHLT